MNLLLSYSVHYPCGFGSRELSYDLWLTGRDQLFLLMHYTGIHTPGFNLAGSWSHTFRNIFFLYRIYRKVHPTATIAMPFRKGAHVSGNRLMTPLKKNLDADLKLIIF